jgi:hypothetical protein
VIESNVAEAVALSPAVQEQLSVDGCARQFVLNKNKIGASDIQSLHRFLLGEAISVGESLVLLSRLIGNEFFESLFFNRPKGGIRMTLSKCAIERRVDFESADLSVLSVEALNGLLSNEFVSVENEDTLLNLILNLGPNYQSLLRHIQIRFLSVDGLSLLEEYLEIPPESLWSYTVERITHQPLLVFDSRILSGFPEIFAEFRAKQISLLWRGSRDGFGAFEFHKRCDGHMNTLTVILDMEGNIFGGFTPVPWESRKWNGLYLDKNNCLKEDESLQSFLFTLVNQYNVPAKRFALKIGEMRRAIACDADWGPSFCDIGVSDNCNTNKESFTLYFGSSYTNNPELGGGPDSNTFLTESGYFQVKEIEIFEITD